MGATGKLLTLAAPGLLLASALSAFPQQWTQTSAPITNWGSIAMSADGTKMVAGVTGPYYSGGPLYHSTNSGVTWHPSAAPIQTWRSIAASADGSRFVAVPDGGGIYASTDSGATWTLTSATNSLWQSVASSADGTKLVAVETNTGPFFGFIHASTNSGATWIVTSAPSFAWVSITCSADGTVIVAGGHRDRLAPAKVYVSTNSGADWTYVETGVATESAVASADGHTMALAGFNTIATSADFGSTWNVGLQLFGPAHPPLIHSIAASADGRKLIAVADFSYSGHPVAAYASTNSGVTWFETSVPTSNLWAVASSADGFKLAAVVGYPSGGIYTWQTTPSPKLNVSASASGLLISWIVPSMPFVLQEAADLNAADWTDVTTQPTLNLTNLHHEVSMPLSSSNRFYRLKSL